MQFDLERLAMAQLADHGLGAAEHRRARRQRGLAGQALNQFARIEQARDLALLVQRALAVAHTPAAHLETVPVVGHIVEAPDLRADRFVAHLLGHRHVVGLDLAIGVVRPDADVQPIVTLQQHDFDFAGVRPRRRLGNAVSALRTTLIGEKRVVRASG